MNETDPSGFDDQLDPNGSSLTIGDYGYYGFNADGYFSGLWPNPIVNSFNPDSINQLFNKNISSPQTFDSLGDVFSGFNDIPNTSDPNPNSAPDNGGKWLSGINAALTVASFAPGPVGSIANAAQAGLDLVQGHYVEAGIDAAGIALSFVGLGVAAKAIKLAREARLAKNALAVTTDATKAGAGQRVARFFYDNRQFKTISRDYWAANGPADGRSLHHWLIPQRATGVPQGFRNAGFNLMELPPIVDTPFGGLNQWMGMSRSPWAPVVDWGIRIGVPAGIGGAAYGGAKLGESVFDDYDSGY